MLYVPIHCYHLPVKCKILFYKLYILPLLCTLLLAGVACPRFSLSVSKSTIGNFFVSCLVYPLSSLLLPCMSLQMLVPLSTHRQKLICTFAQKFKLALHPPHLSVYNWFRTTDGSQTRCSVALPKAKTSSFVHSPLFVAYSAWLALPATTHNASTLDALKYAHWIHHHLSLPCFSVLTSTFLL